VKRGEGGGGEESSAYRNVAAEKRKR
jgi:hypothetical protein